VMNRMYTAGPDGYCGDEDNGQTSAWYVFSALGFYPVCPGTDEYVLGAPLFKKATLHFENGRDLTISAPDNSVSNRYIYKCSVNAKLCDRNFLCHEELLEGGQIDIVMSAEPNKLRGISDEAMPYSFSKE
uniref:glycoside hydrolase domain-containing protein n=1 Tax=Bacteroides sp. TaxID=29523 RepID=UPI0026376982